MYWNLKKAHNDLHSNSISEIHKKNNFKYGNRDTYYRIVYNSAKNWKQPWHLIHISNV